MADSKLTLATNIADPTPIIAATPMIGGSSTVAAVAPRLTQTATEAAHG